MPASLPYHEPEIQTLLIYTSFILLLNVVNSLVDAIAYCGLLGQVLLGVAWGTPGGKFLGTHAEEIIVNLGYLGLILLVWEGGLSTSFRSVKANLALSACIAATGIALPIGLSYVLLRLAGASALQSFAAGAALCSTSLGTTFTVMSTSGLATTRMGVLLTSAAIMDDVVGLVMVQVISNLGGSTSSAGKESSSSFSYVTVIRPVFVSLALAVSIPIMARFVVRPLTLASNAYREKNRRSRFNSVLGHEITIWLVHTTILVALVTGATFAGTSNLFASYLAGAASSWWDAEMPHMETSVESETSENATPVQATEISRGNPNEESTQPPAIAGAAQGLDEARNKRRKDKTEHSPLPDEDCSVSITGEYIYEKYYYDTVRRILKPFFFASIGFSIPITRMFSGGFIWRGLVYALLMAIGKLACGVWLVRFSAQLWPELRPLMRPFYTLLRNILKVFRSSLAPTSKSSNQGAEKENKPPVAASAGTAIALDQSGPLAGTHTAQTNDSPKEPSPLPDASPLEQSHTSDDPPKPVSLYPCVIVGSAMVARGEIGFLISSVAESNGIFGDNSEDASEIYLVVTWAILLCTFVGPICVGLLVKRLKNLERRKGRENATNLLGKWGVY